MCSERPAATARIHAWDVALAVWVAACLGLAVWTGVEVRQLSDVSDTLIVSSRALDTTATAIDRLRQVPLVGQDVGDVADRISQTADSARASGASSRATIRRLSLLLAFAIFVIAVVPPVVAYLVVRRRLIASRTVAR